MRKIEKETQKSASMIFLYLLEVHVVKRRSPYRQWGRNGFLAKKNRSLHVLKSKNSKSARFLLGLSYKPIGNCANYAFLGKKVVRELRQKKSSRNISPIDPKIYIHH